VRAHRVQVVFQPSTRRAARGAGDLELLADRPHDLTAQLTLVGEVPVERRRLHAQLRGQAAEGERPRAFGVHQPHGLLDDLLPGEAGAPPAGAPSERG